MLDLIKEYIIKFTDFVCGWPLFTLLIGGGIFLFIYSRALPLRKLGMAVSSLKMKKKGEGQVSSFQALMNTISSTVGMGEHRRGRDSTMCRWARSHLLDVGQRFAWNGHKVL